MSATATEVSKVLRRAADVVCVAQAYTTHTRTDAWERALSLGLVDCYEQGPVIPSGPHHGRPMYVTWWVTPAGHAALDTFEHTGELL